MLDNILWFGFQKKNDVTDVETLKPKKLSKPQTTATIIIGTIMKNSLILISSLIILLLTTTSVVRAENDTLKKADTVLQMSREQFLLDSMRLKNDAHLRIMELEANEPYDASRVIAPIMALSIPIIGAICVFWFLYHSSQAKKAVHLAMIEKGMDPSTLTAPVDTDPRSYRALRIGMFLFCAALGFLVAVLFASAGMFSKEYEAFVVFGSGLGGGGLGLVLYSFVIGRLEAKKNQQ